MKAVTIAEAQTQLLKLASQSEPLVLTEDSRPLAVLIHINDAPGQLVPGENSVSVLRLKDVLADQAILATLTDDAVCVVGAVEKRSTAGEKRDWWQALERIGDGQKARGFVGGVAEIDRDDEGYEERMAEIYTHTVSKGTAG